MLILPLLQVAVTCDNNNIYSATTTMARVVRISHAYLGRARSGGARRALQVSSLALLPRWPWMLRKMTPPGFQLATGPSHGRAAQLARARQLRLLERSQSLVRRSSAPSTFSSLHQGPPLPALQFRGHISCCARRRREAWRWSIGWCRHQVKTP